MSSKVNLDSGASQLRRYYQLVIRQDLVVVLIIVSHFAVAVFEM